MSSIIPTPDAPLVTRAGAAALLFVTMPLWWPIFVCLFVVLWLIIGFVIAIVCVVMIGAPLMALQGVEPDTTTKFEFKVDNDKVDDFKAAAEAVGVSVEKK